MVRVVKVESLDSGNCCFVRVVLCKCEGYAYKDDVDGCGVESGSCA